MPSETEQLKVKVSLIDESKIAILIDNYEEFQKYTTNGQKGKNTFVYCMQGSKLLRIQINNGSHQKGSTNQLEVELVSTINGNDGWDGVEEVEEIKKLLDLSEEKKSQEIEIFKDFRLKLKKPAGEKEELQTKLAQANIDLENAKKEAEEKQQGLQTQLAQVEGKDKQIKELNEQVQKLQQEKEKLETDNPDIANLQQQLNTAQLQQQQLSAEVEKLKKEKKELEAQKQPTEQPKPGKAPTYTAVVGVGLAAGLVAFTALDRTVRLDIWVTVGIAVVAALAISGGTYLALKPSTQVSETQEPQNTNVKGCCKV